MQLIDQNIVQIRNLCLKSGITRLYVFGSMAKGSSTNESDIDLLVEIEDTDPLEYSNKYFNLKFSLEDTFGRKIDLLESKAIKNPSLKKEIDNTKTLLYG